MSKLRLLGFSAALVVAALVGGTIMSVVAASPRTAPAAVPAAGPIVAAASGAPVREPSEACQAFRAEFAKNLGKSEEEVTAAAKAAIATSIDAAVARGDLSAETGAKLKTKVEASTADGCSFLKHWNKRIGKATGKAALGAVTNGVQAAATELRLTPAELWTMLKARTDLKAIAEDQGVPYEDLSKAIVDSVKTDLDAAVAAGRIRQEKADKILARLEASLADGRLRGGGKPDKTKPATEG